MIGQYAVIDAISFRLLPQQTIKCVKSVKQYKNNTGKKYSSSLKDPVL